MQNYKILIQIILGFFVVGSVIFMIRTKSKFVFTQFKVYVILIASCYSLPWILAKLTGSVKYSANLNNGLNELVDLGWVQPFIYPLVDIVALSISIIYIFINLIKKPILNLQVEVLVIAIIPFLSIISRLIIQNQVPNGQPILVALFIFAIAISKLTVHEVISTGAVITLFTAWLSSVFILIIPDQALMKCVNKCTLLENLASGSASHYNQLGMAMALGFSFVWFNFYGKWRYFFVSFILLTLYLSGSRTAYLSVVLQIFVAVLFSKRKHIGKSNDFRYLIAAFMTFCTLIVVTILPFQTSSDYFATGRGYLWRLAISYLNQSPFIGMGAKFWTDQYASGILSKAAVYSPHNLLLDVLLLSGAIGGLVFLLVIVGWITKALHQQDGFNLTLLLGFVTLSIVESPISFSTANSTSWFLILLFSAFSISCQGKNLEILSSRK